MIKEEKTSSTDLGNDNRRDQPDQPGAKHMQQTLGAKKINSIGNKEKKRKLKKSRNSKLPKAKRRRFIIRVALISSIITALLLATLFAATKINFRISDELSLEMSPSQQSHAISNTESATIKFSLKNNNLFQCNTVCNFTLYDYSQDSVAYQSIESLTHKERVDKSFDVNAPGKGSGQLIYRFEASCNNVRTLICLTNEEKRLISSIAIVNYDLSAEEKDFKESYKAEIEEYLKVSAESLQSLERALDLASSVPSNILEARELRAGLEGLNSTIIDMHKNAETVKDNWNSENYLAAKTAYDTTALNALKSANDEVLQITSHIEELIKLRNNNAEMIKQALQETGKMLKMSSYFHPNTLAVSFERLSSMNNYALGLQQAHAALAVGRKHSEYELNLELTRLRSSYKEQYEKYLETKAILHLQTIYSISLLKALDEYVYENNSAELTNESIDPELNIIKASQSKQSSSPAGSIGQACKALNSSISKLVESNQNAMALREQINAVNNTSLMLRLQDAQEVIKSKAINYSIQAIQFEPELEDEAKAISIQLASTFKFTDPGHTPTEFEARLAVIDVLELQKHYNSTCLTLKSGSALNTQALTQLTLIKPDDLDAFKIQSFEKKFQNASLESDSSKELLAANPPICCVFSNCMACCTSPDCAGINYPTIFVHGHAFNERNTPELSLSLFSKLQKRMEKDGYLNLARLDLREKQQGNAGVFGISNHPVTMTASYYYITHYQLGDYSISIRNDEGLETYSIRLKEIIDDVKWKTGKDKVNIIAHSMGGLVAREYIYLFGSSDVNKFISINTPHMGVSGRSGEWCSVLGAKKECRDLLEGSIFLSRLNSKPVPIGLKVYSIRSTGCLMEGILDGDGIVTGQSATLEGAANYEIRGNCTDSLRSNLHNNALDPDLYPELYYLLIKLLKE